MKIEIKHVPHGNRLKHACTGTKSRATSDAINDTLRKTADNALISVTSSKARRFLAKVNNSRATFSSDAGC
jgi:hypothetical protein